MPPDDVERTIRAAAPRALGRLVRRHGQFDRCEDALQEALVAASTQWPRDGIPNDAVAWLVTVANRRFIDAVRSDQSRRARERGVVEADSPLADAVALDAASGDEVDDTLQLMLLCCHPALTPSSQVALTLRAVGGLTTQEIARAYVVPESTMGQRIARAKDRIMDAGARFVAPDGADRAARMRAVLHVLYLIFNEGHTVSSGDALVRADLTSEAIRLTQRLHEELPDDGEVTGLLALMLLVDSHRAARTDANGALVPLAEQDRTVWDREEIDEGIALVTQGLSASDPGPYLLQAAIAALHAEAPTAEVTDWPQIVALYRVLDHAAPSPVVTLNHAVAVSMVAGPQAGLAMLGPLGSGVDAHRVAAVRAHLLELAGDLVGARAAYLAAASLTTSTPERRYLEARAARLT